MTSLLSRKTRVAATLVVALATVLLGTEAALAHDQYPSQHHAAVYGCYTTSTTGTWTVRSGVQMYRADGYPGSIIGVGGSTVDPQTGAITGNYGPVFDGFTQQWLYYQVVVGTQLTSGAWHWDYGNWIRRKDALGDQTDGISTEFQLDNGTWVTTGYSMAGYWNGSMWVGSPSDVSFVTRYSMIGGIAVGPGRKYVYGRLWWGPIYNLAGRQAFAPYEHWEPLGYVTCA